jgi:hypothetical protein
MAAATVPAAVQCPACSSEGRIVPGQDVRVLTCKGCGGLFTRGLIEDELALSLVRLNDPMLPNASTVRYFDFSLVGRRRFHGWFDVNTKQVIQWG